MQSTFNVRTVRELIDLAVSGKLNPDPISQRPATSSGHKKSQEIIEAINSKLGVGMITVRNIQLDPKMQEVYPGVIYLVIDGGHRIRAMVEYYTNKFKLNGKFFKEIDDHEEFLNYQIPFENIVCSSSEATKIFKTRNKTTSVNFIEMIMCDDESVICREVRSRTKFYREYQNKVLPAFSVITKDGDTKPECFDTDVNPRRKWDEYVFIAILKAISGGNVDAGQREIETLVQEEYRGKNPVSKRVLVVVDRFFADLVSFRYERGKKLNGDIFAAFQAVWFALYERNTEFTISHNWKFMSSFMESYSRCTGTGDRTYNNKIVNIGTADEEELVNFKEFIRANTKNFSNSIVQRKCADFLLEEMGNDIGVTFRDAKRSLSSAQREERLAIQKYKCAIDNESLTLQDSVWGHDTPWAKGGALEDGAVIRKSHNTDMGSTTLDEYRLILDMRKNKVA
jgi:hypothetical protein